MLPSSSFTQSSLQPRPRPQPPPPPPPQDMSFRSPCSFLWRDLYPYPDLDPDLNLVVDDTEAELPLDLFLPLIWGDLDLNPDLVLTQKENPPTSLPLLLSPPSSSPSLLLRLRQPWLHPTILTVDISATVLHRICPYVAGWLVIMIYFIF